MTSIDTSIDNLKRKLYFRHFKLWALTSKQLFADREPLLNFVITISDYAGSLIVMGIVNHGSYGNSYNFV